MNDGTSALAEGRQQHLAKAGGVERTGSVEEGSYSKVPTSANQNDWRRTRAPGSQGRVERPGEEEVEARGEGRNRCGRAKTSEE